MNFYSAFYRKAFVQYLRQGTAIDLSLKAVEQPTTHYIWRTAGDDKVRSSHAANNGKIFSWDTPPETGHPGEDYGCRCWAELILDSVDSIIEGYYSFLWSLLTPPWDLPHFTVYFYIGFGQPINLRQIGHLEKVIHVAKGSVYPRAENYFKIRAKNAEIGEHRDTFNNSYDFGEVNYVHGGSKIDGEFVGQIILKNGKRIMSGKISYSFSDTFTDPLNIVEALEKIPKVEKEDIPRIVKVLANFLGIAYPITGEWVEDVSFEL